MSAKSPSYIGIFFYGSCDFKYDFNSEINSFKMQQYIRMIILLTILFAIHRFEFATNHLREDFFSSFQYCP